MIRIALGLEYDGSHFHGWQRQTALPSVQESLETALSQIAEELISTVCAGRTDKGVHATAQVVHFDTTVKRRPEAWVLGVNTLLPRTVRVLWGLSVHSDFDARRSAMSRCYRYIIYNHHIRPSLFRNYVSWIYKKLDVQKMKAATEYWIGELDFNSFRATRCQSHSSFRRVHSIEIARQGCQVILEFRANAFLHHMVRNMAGVLIEIGSGEKPVEWAKEVLEKRDRTAAGITAPATGLYLIDVQYPSAFALPKEDVTPWFLSLA
jgi:tRNA pseudouridine38-40 synthase